MAPETGTIFRRMEIFRARAGTAYQTGRWKCGMYTNRYEVAIQYFVYYLSTTINKKGQKTLQSNKG